MFQVTTRAAAKLREVLGQGEEPLRVRLELDRFNARCSAFGIRLVPAPAVGEGDRVVQVDGVQVVLDPDTADQLQAARLDYRRPVLGVEDFFLVSPFLTQVCELQA